MKVNEDIINNSNSDKLNSNSNKIKSNDNQDRNDNLVSYVTDKHSKITINQTDKLQTDSTLNSIDNNKIINQR
jgi:hypothetical protein